MSQRPFSITGLDLSGYMVKDVAIERQGFVVVVDGDEAVRHLQLHISHVS